MKKIIIDNDWQEKGFPPYEEGRFWQKLRASALKAGRKLVRVALELYYVAKDRDTPGWVRTAIYGGLAYFILPLDFLPDLTPLIGYSDDLAVLMALYNSHRVYRKPYHRWQAEEKLRSWFGN